VEMLNNDFATRGDLLKQLNADKEEVSLAKLREEINIYYVAATRGKKSVMLAEF
jgi:ATP-dependent exoDNAse (exonuclease V) beta subunit